MTSGTTGVSAPDQNVITIVNVPCAIYLDEKKVQAILTELVLSQGSTVGSPALRHSHGHHSFQLI